MVSARRDVEVTSVEAAAPIFINATNVENYDYRRSDTETVSSDRQQSPGLGVVKNEGIARTGIALEHS